MDEHSFRVRKIIYTATSDTSLDRIVLLADSYRPTVINSISRHFTSCSYGPRLLRTLLGLQRKTVEHVIYVFDILK